MKYISSDAAFDFFFLEVLCNCKPKYRMYFPWIPCSIWKLLTVQMEFLLTLHFAFRFCMFVEASEEICRVGDVASADSAERRWSETSDTNATAERLYIKDSSVCVSWPSLELINKLLQWNNTTEIYSLCYFKWFLFSRKEGVNNFSVPRPVCVWYRDRSRVCLA